MFGPATTEGGDVCANPNMISRHTPGTKLNVVHYK